MAFSSGFGGYVKVGAVQYNVESWDFDFSAEILDTTSVGDNSYQTNIMGVRKGMLNFKIYYDPSYALMTDFRPGTTATVVLMLGVTGAQWTATVRISSFKTENPVKGVVPATVTAETTGSFTAPS